jgi:hypothetical protein
MSLLLRAVGRRMASYFLTLEELTFGPVKEEVTVYEGK